MTHKDKPLITIVGVLGKQGRSVARTLLQSGRYRVRGLTRRVDSPEALDLAGQGAELVNVPLDLGYKKDFVKAFRGSDGVFMLTPTIVPPATHELELGRQLADAAMGHLSTRSLPQVLPFWKFFPTHAGMPVSPCR
jgi:uncharacterized protein YbjT (DUF2867 family)